MRYRKKPVEVEAVRWDGNNVEKVRAFFGGRGRFFVDRASNVRIDTLEGRMTASPGDWVIRGVKGEFYPCKPDIFEATYEPVEPEAST